MNKIFVDTNIFLRFLLNDHPTQSPKCRELFVKAKKGKVKLITHSFNIFEVTFTLHKFYNLSLQDVANMLKKILVFSQIEIVNRDVLMSAVEAFENKNISIADAFSAYWAISKGITSIYSFDKDFDKISEIRRIEP